MASGCPSSAHHDFKADQPGPLIIERDIPMNKHQVKGALKDTAGKAQEQAGKATGNATQEAKGLAKQGEGKAQTAYGNVKEILRNSRHS
jgi:uncharacterized protein YjbJ (UPF0337 family)